eukprot:TRINITY_DN696_c0_g1_i1.p1 TRINITY_DN696_c0_g1~~TRINITY_DN696_c0_g1_i1.p1  ORF type:complete len:187 (-),score=48.88 TRINITY_DN696_c0_g1_i1:77-637(-)
MKFFSLVLCRVPGRAGPHPDVLGVAHELSSFSIFQRGTVKEWSLFISKTLVENSSKGVRQSVNEKEGVCHVYVRGDGIGAVAITDLEYPARSAFVCIMELVNSSGKHALDLDEMLRRYQDPAAGDKVQAVMKQVDDTKLIMHKNIDTVLQNHQSLDQLVDSTDQLSRQSKLFYKKAKETNRCCSIM